jgi:hypothetical protein
MNEFSRSEALKTSRCLQTTLSDIVKWCKSFNVKGSYQLHRSGEDEWLAKLYRKLSEEIITRATLINAK